MGFLALHACGFQPHPPGLARLYRDLGDNDVSKTLQANEVAYGTVLFCGSLVPGTACRLAGLLSCSFSWSSRLELINDTSHQGPIPPDLPDAVITVSIRTTSPPGATASPVCRDIMPQLLTW